MSFILFHLYIHLPRWFCKEAGQRLTLGYLPPSLLHLIFRIGSLSLGPELYISARMAAQQAPRSASLHLGSAGITDVHCNTQLICGVPRTQTRVPMLAHQTLYALGHLPGPYIFFLSLIKSLSLGLGFTNQARIASQQVSYRSLSILVLQAHATTYCIFVGAGNLTQVLLHSYAVNTLLSYQPHF